jgi:hypothetical protein
LEILLEATMPFQLQNHNVLDRSLPRPIPAALAMIGMSLLFLAPVSFAQSHTSTSSSSGKGATPSSASHVASPSLQSNSVPAHTATSSGTARNGEAIHHARGYWRGGVYYPYAVGASGAADANGASGSSEAECQGGPTIFDRCSPAPGYIAPTNSGPAHGPAGRASASASNSSGAASPTTLVFKDGHEVEVDDFAVAGQTLYDLTPGRSQKIALSDLDLSATQKQNPGQDAVFTPPSSAHSN